MLGFDAAAVVTEVTTFGGAYELKACGTEA